MLIEEENDFKNSKAPNQLILEEKHLNSKMRRSSNLKKQNFRFHCYSRLIVFCFAAILSRLFIYLFIHQYNKRSSKTNNDDEGAWMKIKAKRTHIVNYF